MTKSRKGNKHAMDPPHLPVDVFAHHVLPYADFTTLYSYRYTNFPLFVHRLGAYAERHEQFLVAIEHDDHYLYYRLSRRIEGYGHPVPSDLEHLIFNLCSQGPEGEAPTQILRNCIQRSSQEPIEIGCTGDSPSTQPEPDCDIATLYYCRIRSPVWYRTFLTILRDPSQYGTNLAALQIGCSVSNGKAAEANSGCSQPKALMTWKRFFYLLDYTVTKPHQLIDAVLQRTDLEPADNAASVMQLLSVPASALDILVYYRLMRQLLRYLEDDKLDASVYPVLDILRRGDIVAEMLINSLRQLQPQLSDELKESDML